jgi:hypothetical protein
MSRHRSTLKTNPGPIPSKELALPLPTYRLPVVAAAFAAGVLCTTRPVRQVLCGMLRTVVALSKPALVVGGLLKLREMADRPSLDSTKSHPTPR